MVFWGRIGQQIRIGCECLSSTIDQAVAVPSDKGQLGAYELDDGETDSDDHKEPGFKKTELTRALDVFR